MGKTYNRTQLDARLRSTLVPLTVVMTIGSMLPTNAHALRAANMSGNDNGAVVVYSFESGNSGDNGDGTFYVNDVNGSGLNLSSSTEGNLASQTPILHNAFFSNGALIINRKPNVQDGMADQGYVSAQRHRTYFVSPAIGNQFAACAANQEYTIQAFVRPYFPFHGDNGGMIVGLSNSTLTTLATPNMAILQTGRKDDETATVRTRMANGQANSLTSIAKGFSSVREGENLGQITEIIATRKGGRDYIYLNRVLRSSTSAPNLAFAAGSKIVIGNDITQLTTMQQQGMTVPNVNNQRNWSGEIYHVAIYCNGFSKADILGPMADNKATADVVKPELTPVASQVVRREAIRMVERLSGGPVPYDHPMVIAVEQKLFANDRLGAAKIVTGDVASGLPGHPNFLNVVVKQMALKMSNREETVRVPLNDFAAGFIGLTRDERSAKELLTEDFYYMADPAKAAVPSDMFADLIVSNKHYEQLEKAQWDLGKVLVRRTGQKIAKKENGELADSPDPAGILTSRAFLSEHAIAGTNRRLVEYAFREFMCVQMSDMADTSASGARIGRDVERVPGGDALKFETNCKGCHTVMDGFRGAFAKFDYGTKGSFGFVRHSQVNDIGPEFGFPPAAGNVPSVNSNFIVRKLNHNESNFPLGYEITDDSFVNNAVGAANKNVFGWRGSNKNGGYGVNQFGRMIADSKRYSQCLAKRAFETVCMAGQKSENKVTPVVESIANKFEESGYKMRVLFQEAAANPACGLNRLK